MSSVRNYNVYCILYSSDNRDVRLHHHLMRMYCGHVKYMLVYLLISVSLHRVFGQA
jgi:hypothetical protein